MAAHSSHALSKLQLVCSVPDSCSRLLCPSSPFSHAHTGTHHQPDSSPPGLAQWACHKKASAYGSTVGWTPAQRNNNSKSLAHQTQTDQDQTAIDCFKECIFILYFSKDATTTIVLWPLYRTTCVSSHPQFITGGFCWSKILLPACRSRWQVAHSD